MVSALGGPHDLIEQPARHLSVAPLVAPIAPARAGVVGAIDVRRIGLAIIALGGGRTRPDDGVDHAVGLTEVAGLGEPVGPDRPLCRVHARDDASAAHATAQIRAAFTIADTAPASMPVIIERL